MTTFTILPEGRYRTDEFIRLLGRALKRPMSDRTLRDWCNYFGISRDEQGYFWKEDYLLLRAWIKYRQKYGRTRNRQDFLIEYRAKQSKKTRQTQTIDVHTQEV